MDGCGGPTECGDVPSVEGPGCLAGTASVVPNWASADRPAVFLTGFPGFLGSALLDRLLRQRPGAGIACLIQPQFRPLAERRLAALAADGVDVASRVRLVAGDITADGLGIDHAVRTALLGSIRQIFHLAAAYDLAVPAAVAERVNVTGTGQVVDWAGHCSRLERFDYVSTCYVSGRWPGRFTEADLDGGQRFNNHYERTKFWAELVVREAAGCGLPATVYRPSIVVGDSVTGETAKYDGPYFLLQLLARQRPIAVVPLVGDPGRHLVNIVPRDFVVAAIAALSAHPAAIGHTYALADPSPLSVRDLLDAFASELHRRVLAVRVPRRAAKSAVRRAPGLGRLLRLPAEVIDYLDQPTEYGTAATSPVLAELGIACPPVRSYIGRLVAFFRSHPELAAAGLR